MIRWADDDEQVMAMTIDADDNGQDAMQMNSRLIDEVLTATTAIDDD